MAPLENVEIYRGNDGFQGPPPRSPPGLGLSIFRASCPKLGARSSAPQCVAGSDVAERQRGVATDDVAKRMAQATKTKRGETPAAGWIEGPPRRGGG